MNSTLLPNLSITVQGLDSKKITEKRKEVLQELIDYIQKKMDLDNEIKLNFICTHNSRRSQFSQIWAQTAANYYRIPLQSYSGGVEVTAFNERAVESIKRAGFLVTQKGEGNPIYYVLDSNDSEPMVLFSKQFDDAINPSRNFAAVMTCSHADENCPFIPGAEQRIPVRYEDPKAFDDTDLEKTKYDERSLDIANEMFYVFSKIVKK